MAEAIANHLARARDLPVRAESAGTQPADHIQHTAEDAVAEIGVSMDGQKPKAITQEMVGRADRIITMGCGVDLDACPARFLASDDWGLDDPAGQPMATVRRVRDDIVARVGALLDEIAS